MEFAEPRRRPQEEAILPLINVVFLLLIFFMLAGSLAASDPVPADPPLSTNEGETGSRDLVIVMGADGLISVDGAIVEEDGLAAAIEAALAANASRSIWLKADAQADSLKVIALMDALQEAGAERVKLLTAQAE